MDYLMPTAPDVPHIESYALELPHHDPATENPLGVKGCGEVGAIGSPPAVMNAVVDALRDYGVRHIEMPATPAKIWSIINAGRPKMAAE
jgi:carbon-monoxide dehydrogenase large subunit